MKTETPDFLKPSARGGLLPRAELARFIAACAEHLGFQFESDDLLGVRQSGRALHLRRKRVPGPPLDLALQLELQYRWAETYYCYGWIHEGVAYATQKWTIECENGSYTETYSAEGAMHTHTATLAYEDCPSTTFDTDKDPEFDYGEILDSEIEYLDPLDASALITAALGALENDGSPYLEKNLTWLEGDTPPSVGTVGLGYRTFAGSALYNCMMRSWPYRWKNPGEGPLRIQWTASGGSNDITLDPGENSDWYDDDPGPSFASRDTITSVTISEV